MVQIFENKLEFRNLQTSRRHNLKSRKKDSGSRLLP